MKKVLLPFFIASLLLFYNSVKAQSDDYIIHTIKHGEVFSVLAKKYNVSLDDILKLNNFTADHVLHVGDRVKLPVTAHLTQGADSTQPVAAQPSPTTAGSSSTIEPAKPAPATSDNYVLHTVQHGEILSVLSKKYHVKIDDIVEINHLGADPIMHVGDVIKLPSNAYTQAKPDSSAQNVPAVSHPAAPVSTPAVKNNTDTSAAPHNYVLHTVEHGEVLSVLSKKYHVKIDDIVAINHLGTDPILHVGDVIKLPANAYTDPTSSVQHATVVSPPPHPVAPVAKPKQPDTVAVPSKYVLHTIQHGEYLSVLAKRYHVSVADIISLNGFDANHILHVGDVVKLPPSAVEDTPSSTTKVPVAPAQSKPLTTATVAAAKPQDTAAISAPNTGTHMVKSKETLYSIAKQYNVTVSQLKEWNSLADNNIDVGQTLIVSGSTSPVSAPAVSQAKPEDKQLDIAPAPAPSIQPVKTTTDISTANIPVEGYFAPLFGKDVAGRSLQTSTGAAMTFKTASGWNDKKYYVLMNGVSPGSIVKLTSGDGKSVFAKILWSMGDMTENDGLNFRISDAAASVLGIKDAKFQITVTYYE